MTEEASKTPREKVFTEKMILQLSPEQNRWLENEVMRRKKQGIVSDVPAAHGGNRNVNKGMVLREALEVKMKEAAA